MKPFVEAMRVQKSESFLVLADDRDYPFVPLGYHFHPEYEIVLNIHRHGKYFIGDCISNFESGTLVFLGANLPHSFKPDFTNYQPNPSVKYKSIVIKFLDTALSKSFLAMPQAKGIKDLLLKSSNGMKITGCTCTLVTQKMHEIVTLNSLERWIKLVEILHLLAETEEYEFISSMAVKGSNEKESNRIDEVLKFIIENFGRDINLIDAAKVAKMAENSFARFFKQRTQKTFTSYLNEFRLNHAAKLLLEKDMTIVDVCNKCGFVNLSNFHRHFKKMYNTSPLNYRKRYWDKVRFEQHKVSVKDSSSS